MAYAESSRVQVIAGKESTYGVAQTTLELLRPSSASISLALSKDTFESAEIRSDRQVSDMRHGNKNIAGDIGGHLSYTDWDLLFGGLLGNTWSTASFTLTSTSVSFASSTNKISASTSSDWTGLSTGDVIKVSGSTDNDGYYEVTDITGADVTVAHGTLTTESSGASVTIVNRSLLVPGTSKDSYTIEVGYTDIGRYHQFTGCLVNTGAITIAPNAMVNCSFGMVGSNLTTASASLDSSPTAASTNNPFSGIDASSITEGGSTITVVTDLTINIDNGVNNNYTLGSASSREATQSKFRVTGSANMFFDDDTMVTKFVNETETSIQVLLLDPNSNPFWIDLPRVKYSSGSPSVGDGAITLSMEFTALVDSTTGHTMILAQ